MSDKFEKERIILEKERVLTYSKLSCPLGCRYCFVGDLNIEQQKDAVYLSEKQTELLFQLPSEIKLIMLGCDTEFLQDKKSALEILGRLIKTGRDISIITKLSLPPEFIKNLSEINRKLNKNGNFLIFSISLTCLESAKIWEPKVPAPAKRIETLRSVHESGIKTLLALRPLLPTISDSELESVIKLTEGISCGFYSGPLYLKNLDEDPIRDIKDLIIEKVEPDWMPKGNSFYKVEKAGQMENLKNVIEKYNKKLFDGVAEAVKYLKENEKY
ncbi:MAG: hypothetical protein A2750_03055 [Candidatus Yanofskybacteria bacterium RIFCSPHIGHO2_01_FULL_45_42]|uniref:Radical SAM core domain-containing protein n=1 Tax=Candidatus Yanofskybacteria bacterium RIFCSPHIGHO2_01_FULL_45_42 TaxID=1802671 RepID=A0A1F8F3V7_9BACT|nr:MAG: hypothetical protein A2750_03055 [Candidatus Yanofskybacteria bacterium RIFCSPHIGHO2_01_FULL_45_42]OGN27376.1 MAG: hypothetical protein A3B17_00225 [Candidatus Yanofskybacteria bacterium RIFCSPLOWO2_01_FULL_45_72]